MTHSYGPEVALGLAAGEAKLHDGHMPLPKEHWHGCTRGLSQMWRNVMGQQVGVLPCAGCQREGDASEEQELWGVFPALQASLSGKPSRGAQAPSTVGLRQKLEGGSGQRAVEGQHPRPHGEKGMLPSASQKSFPHAASDKCLSLPLPRRQISPALCPRVTERPPLHLLYSAVRDWDAPPLPPGPGSSRTGRGQGRSCCRLHLPLGPCVLHRQHWGHLTDTRDLCKAESTGGLWWCSSRYRG